MDSAAPAHLAELIRVKNAADGEIAALIGRPCQIEHAGEWIASQVFDIVPPRVGSHGRQR